MIGTILGVFVGLLIGLLTGSVFWATAIIVYFGFFGWSVRRLISS